MKTRIAAVWTDASEQFREGDTIRWLALFHCGVGMPIKNSLDVFVSECYFSSMLFSQHISRPRKLKFRPALSRRERQIMDILYKRRRATAAEVQQVLPDPPSYSAVRAMLRVLEEKGHIRHEEQASRYIFLPTVSREKAKFSALQHLVETFFDGSTEQVVATLLDSSTRKLSRDELNQLSRLIDNAKKQGA